MDFPADCWFHPAGLVRRTPVDSLVIRAWRHSPERSFHPRRDAA